MLGSFASSATASLLVKNDTNKIYQLFEELQGSNSEFELITPKPITRTYFETIMSRFCLVGLPMEVILYFNGNISVFSRAAGLKFRIFAYYPKIYKFDLF